jgi:hypothetical protein
MGRMETTRKARMNFLVMEKRTTFSPLPVPLTRTSRAKGKDRSHEGMKPTNTRKQDAIRKKARISENRKDGGRKHHVAALREMNHKKHVTAYQSAQPFSPTGGQFSPPSAGFPPPNLETGRPQGSPACLLRPCRRFPGQFWSATASSARSQPE